GDRGGTGADHQALQRQPGVAVGGHHALALLERERGPLAGGAEHVEAVAAVGKEEARERGRARAIGRAGLVDCGGDGGDDAVELVRHGSAVLQGIQCRAYRTLAPRCRWRYEAKGTPGWRA